MGATSRAGAASETRAGTHALLEMLFDPGTWRRWDDPVALPAPVGNLTSVDRGYGRALATARASTTLRESVLSGEGSIAGRRCAVIATEPSFLGGSIGVEASARLASAIGRATDDRLPLIAVLASGGTRMQEGTPAFVQMVRVTALLSRHSTSGNPYVVYLRHPVAGGVLASLGALGHVVLGEPGALVGFIGPRVYAALNGREFTAGVQVADHLVEHGVLDALVAPEELRAQVTRILSVLARPMSLPGTVSTPQKRVGTANVRSTTVSRVSATSPWEAVERSRRNDRPGLRDLLTHGAHGVTYMEGGSAPVPQRPVAIALAHFGSERCVVIGQDRGSTHRLVGPQALRSARRAVHVATELGIPIVSVVDAPGPLLTRASEEEGIAFEVGRTVEAMALARVPVVSFLMGEGAGGTALALFPADRVICAQHAWLAALPPEGSAAVMRRDPSWALAIAATQRIGAPDLFTDGVVDVVVPELPDAADEPLAFCRRAGAVIERELSMLSDTAGAPDLEGRLARFARIG